MKENTDPKPNDDPVDISDQGDAHAMGSASMRERSRSAHLMRCIKQIAAGRRRPQDSRGSKRGRGWLTHRLASPHYCGPSVSDE